MAKAVCRMQKKKSLGDIKAMAAHHVRARPTPNADPAGDVLVLVGSGDPYHDVARRLSEAATPRSNAVRAVELVLSAGVEYFRPKDPQSYGTYDPDRVARFAKAVRAWALETYGANLVSLVLHLDEGTPHLHGVVVPIIKGRLNCRAMFSDRLRLRELQGSFAKGVEHLGIERGSRGSTATHTEVRRWYTEEPRRLEERERKLLQKEKAIDERLEDVDEIYRQLVRMIDELMVLDAEAAEKIRDRMRRMFGRL